MDLIITLVLMIIEIRYTTEKMKKLQYFGIWINQHVAATQKLILVFLRMLEKTKYNDYDKDRRFSAAH